MQIFLPVSSTPYYIVVEFIIKILIDDRVSAHSYPALLKVCFQIMTVL